MSHELSREPVVFEEVIVRNWDAIAELAWANYQERGEGYLVLEEDSYQSTASSWVGDISYSTEIVPANVGDETTSRALIDALEGYNPQREVVVLYLPTNSRESVLSFGCGENFPHPPRRDLLC